MSPVLLLVVVAALVGATVELPQHQGNVDVAPYDIHSRVSIRRADRPKPARQDAQRGQADSHPRAHVDFSMAEVVALAKEDGELVWADVRFMNETHGAGRHHHRSRPFSVNEILATLAPAVILGVPMAAWTVWAACSLRRYALRKDDY